MRRRLVLLGGLLLIVGVAGSQEPSLSARVDRSEIRANESFTYVLRAEGRISGTPDLSALARDFDVLQSGSSSQFQIVNGQATQVAEWTVELMPRSEGEFRLPPAALGNQLSNAVTLRVLPAETGQGEAADVFIEVELDTDEAYVQSQVIYILRLFVGIPTGREALVAPPIEGGEAIVESLGSDREYQTVRDDRVYRVRERRFAIFPQTSGVLTIGPAEYQATVIPNRGFSRRQSLRSDSIELEVLPAVAPPTSHPNAVWLPARSLGLIETWGDGAGSFEQGVPRTRELTIIASGVLDTQLPELELAEASGIRQYADQPDLSREVGADGITARRTERLAVIANQPGTVEFPPVELPWWNVIARRWEIATIDARTVDVEPSADAPPPEAAEPGRSPLSPDLPELTDAGLWPWVSAVLAVGWLATAAALAYTLRARRRPSPGRAEPRATSSRTLLKQLVAACRVDDAHRTRELLLTWAARQFSEDPPANLGALAERFSGPLAEEVRSLEAALYGREHNVWRGQKLAELLRTTQMVNRSASNKDPDPLVPLYR